MSNLVKHPGEVWWAFHPWLSRVEFWNKDGSKVTTRSLNSKPSHVHIECKPHPALILAPGDEMGRGYLVCYLSSHSDPRDSIPRLPLKGVTISKNENGGHVPNFAFAMAPCYCDDEFIWGSQPITAVEAGALELVKGILKRSCQLFANQSWARFGFNEVESEIPLERVEEVRLYVRALIDAIRRAEVQFNEKERKCTESCTFNDPNLTFDEVLENESKDDKPRSHFKEIRLSGVNCAWSATGSPKPSSCAGPS